MTVGVLDTPFGAITVRTTALGVARIDFGVHRELLEPSTPGADSHLAIACEQLTEYLAGTRQHFSVELDRSGRFGFRGEVLAALELVPFGEVVSYGELARRSGRPRAARAVGTAMATNPIAVIVPCHRVVRSDGSMGAYGGGSAAKRWLLELEGRNPTG